MHIIQPHIGKDPYMILENSIQSRYGALSIGVTLRRLYLELAQELPKLPPPPNDVLFFNTWEQKNNYFFVRCQKLYTPLVES